MLYGAHAAFLADFVDCPFLITRPLSVLYVNRRALRRYSSFSEPRYR